MEATTRHRFPAVLRAARLALPALAALLFLSACESTDSYGPGAGRFHTVVVDAGHGAYDRGARAVSGQPEKLLTLDTARRLAKILRSKGFRVIETRPQETFIPLGTRAAISNATSDSIFVSVHYNWAKRAAPHGIEIYYYSPRSRRLAANILQEVRRAYPTNNRGVKRNNYYVLRNNKRPAVLCELGFLSSPYDNRYVQNPSYRQKIAERIAQGIIDEEKGLSP